MLFFKMILSFVVIIFMNRFNMFTCHNRTCIVYILIHAFFILFAFFAFLWHVWLATPWVSTFFGPLHMKQF
jgi:hypothetical protein